MATLFVFMTGCEPLMMCFLLGHSGDGEEEGGATAGGEQAPGEAEERADGRLQETDEAHRRPQATEGQLVSFRWKCRKKQASS